MNASSTSTAAPAADDRAEVAQALAGLCGWAHAAARQPLPDEVLAKSAQVFVDDLAAICAAHGQPEIAALAAAALAPAPGAAATPNTGSARLLRPGGPLADPHAAAMINGTAGCWCELDEGYRGAPCHAGLYVLPALLAEAEPRGASLAQVLAMLAVGYEVAARVAEAWTFPAMSVHPHAAYANFGAAAGAALARGVPAATLAAAVRLAGGVVPAGTYQAAVEGALVRNAWTGLAASAGLWAVAWAEAGMDGYPDGPHPAFARLLGAATRAQALTDGLGARWAIAAGYHKLHGCCHSTHAAAEAALAMSPRLDLARGAQGIRRIDLYTHRPGMSNVAPGNSLAARFSFEHVVAVALARRDTGPDAFGRAAIDDPTVAALRRRVRLLPYEPLPAWPQDRAARLEVELADGSVLAEQCLSAPGGPDQPLSPAQILRKAQGLTARDYPGFAGSARAILDLDAATLARPWRELAGAMLAA